MTDRQRLWLFPIALTLHNLEEAVWLPAWSRSIDAPVGESEFRFAVTVITLAAVAITFLASGGRRVWLAAASGFWIAMIVNALFPHLVATIAFGRYAPGLATALLLNVPVSLMLLRTELRQRRLRPRDVVLGAVVMGPALLASLPLLFAMGAWLF